MERWFYESVLTKFIPQWRSKKTGELRKMPTLKVMEIEDLVERKYESIAKEEDRVLEIEGDGAGPASKSRKDSLGVGQLTKIWKKLRVGGKRD